MLTRVAHREAGGHGVRAISLSPGTVATDMQAAIKASGVNPVSQLDWSVHIPAEWPARALVWLCGPGGDAYLGGECSLRDDAVRRAVGLIA
jgi:NAD(P)-dependent dehydrogenase (short-subunit alcohol dehydrogenase family)